MSIRIKITYMNTLGERLRQQRKELKLTQKQIAKETGITASSVTQWELDITSPRGENLYALCRILQCQPGWLLYGKNNPDEMAKNTAAHDVIPGAGITRRVPLISWVQAGEWMDIVDGFEPGDAKKWQETTVKVGPHAFALCVQGDSTVHSLGFPSMSENSIVIVDPDTPVENGKIVIAKLEGSVKATLKKLIIDEPYRYLKPLNPDYRPIQIDENCKIIGVVKQFIFDL